MNIFNLIPAVALRPFIDRFWGWESAPPETVQLPTLLPGTGAELYFHFGAPFRIHANGGHPLVVSPGHLFCLRGTTVNLSPASDIGFIAVRFRIGMLQRFTGIPAKELADRPLSVEDIWGAPGAALMRRLSYALDRQQRIVLITAFLLERLGPSTDLLVEQATTELYRRRSAISIEALADALGLGRRQLERRWKRFSGQSPNEIKGLNRFQQTVRGLMLDPSADATDRALACGYYDQAHFIHDFQRRVGLAPHKYLRVARTKTHFYNTPLPRDDTLGTLKP